MKLAALALLYWALVFVFAFMLGIARVLWVVPEVGEVAATLLELPLVLGASWLVARHLLGRQPLLRPGHAALMGLTAFALLMVSELVLALALGGGAAAGWIARMQTLVGAIGLVGQIGFGLIPWLIVRRVQAQSRQARR
ncbi:MAG TPA: hypothetical protein VLA45_09380 [Paracoccaceae bacterium]|nr:hypothetical protein [Paracoccaceae bacterium]